MLKEKGWVPPTQEQLQKKYKNQLSRLKTHLLRGCSAAWHGHGDEYISDVVEKPFVEITEWKRGRDEYYGFNNRPAVTDDIRKVTCGYCKTKLTNELWFKDWATLTDQEFDLLTCLRARRDARKARGEDEIG